MGLKPSTVEQTKFEYSPLGKIFNKGLSKDDKKEWLFKRLENIKNKNEEQLQAIKDQGEKQLRELKNIEESRTLEAIDKLRGKNAEAKDLVSKIRKIDTELDTSELVCTKTDEKPKYNLNLFASPLKFARKIHNYEITQNEAIDDQEKLKNLIIRLKKHKPRKTRKKRREKWSLRICKKIVLCEKWYY